MRLIIRCSSCQQQFDVSGHAVGAKLHCHCGEVLTVQAARGHDASVVSCSSCGAPRENNAMSCQHCASDFTIHERDLTTVCPQCLARISDRARFCHHCATPIVAEALGSFEQTDLTCPVCKDEKLQSRRLGKEQASVAECEKCGGLWIGKAAFQMIRERIASSSQDAEEILAGSGKATLTKQHGSLYQRQCVNCERMLARRQYARGSGIIIDVCRNHGIWFDAGELESTVRFISSGGRAKELLTSQQSAEAPSAPTVSESRPPRRNEDALTLLLQDLSNNFGNVFDARPRYLQVAGIILALILLSVFRGCFFESNSYRRRSVTDAIALDVVAEDRKWPAVSHGNLQLHTRRVPGTKKAAEGRKR